MASIENSSGADTTSDRHSLESIDTSLNRLSRQPTHQFEILDASLPSPDPHQDNVAEDETIYPQGRTLWLTMVAICLGIVVVGFDKGILSTAVPAITDEFGTIADVGWYNASFRLTRCAFQFMFGRMYTVWNVKRVFLASMLLLLPGNLLCALAPSSKVFVLARAIQGIGCAGIVSGIFTILAELIPVRQRPMAFAAAAFFEQASTALGPVIGGLLTTKLGWRWCFWINIPFLIPALVATFLFYHPIRPSRYQSLPWKQKFQKLDLLGTVILVPSITALLLALQFGGTKYGWTDPRIMSCFAVSILLIGGFTAWQIHLQDDATLPPRIIKKRSIIAGMVFAGFNASAISVVEYYLPIYFQTVLQLSAQESGILTLPYIISFMISILSGGSIIQAIGYWAAPMFVTSLLAPIAIGNLSTLSVTPKSAAIAGWQILLGFAGGLGFQGPAIAVSALLDPEDIAFGIACIQFAQAFLPAVFIPAAQSMFTQLLEQRVAAAVPGLNATSIDGLGLGDLRDKVQASQLSGTLLGFDQALMATFYLPTALACATVFGTLGIEWKSVKKLSRSS